MVQVTESAGCSPSRSVSTNGVFLTEATGRRARNQPTSSACGATLSYGWRSPARRWFPSTPGDVEDADDVLVEHADNDVGALIEAFEVGQADGPCALRGGLWAGLTAERQRLGPCDADNDHGRFLSRDGAGRIARSVPSNGHPPQGGQMRPSARPTT